MIPCEAGGPIGIIGMVMGRESDRQGDLMVSWAEMPRSPGHVFCDRLQEVLIAGGFDLFVETACQPHYEPKMGAPSVPRCRRRPLVDPGVTKTAGALWRLANSGGDNAAIDFKHRLG